MCTCIVKHLILCQRNLLQFHISWTILEGYPVASALIFKFLLSSTTIADDGGVNKVCSDKIGLLPKPITKDIVGTGESLFIQNILFHDH